MLGLALALSSSVCWGVSDFIGGVQARRVSLLRVILVSEGVGLGCLVILLAARGAGPPDLVRLLPAAAAGLGGTAALAAFYRALAIGTMSIVAPISATGVAVPVVVGIAGGDRPAPLQLAGILAAVVGVVLASREAGAGSQERGVARASVTLALVAALGFGLFFVGLRSSARADVLWALFTARAAGVLALLAIAAVRRGSGRRVGAGAVGDAGGHAGSRAVGEAAGHAGSGAPAGAGRSALPLVTIGILDLAANGLYALATRHGLLSVVAVASSLYPLATVLLARALLGERVRAAQELGIATALAGVVMIAAG